MAWESRQQLRVIDSTRDSEQMVYVLTEKQYEIGRLPAEHEAGTYEILFLEPTLSRVHATLTWKARARSYQLLHKSDINPTLVNGRPVRKILLAPGDRIQLGFLILELEEAPHGARSRGFDQTENLQRIERVIAWAQEKYAHVKLG